MAYVGLGANVGDAAATLTAAAAELARLPGVVGARRSRWYASAPVGRVADQPWFVNGVVELRFASKNAETKEPPPPHRGWGGSYHVPQAPHKLLEALLAIERRFGRDRTRETPQGPRTLDLDLLLWGDLVLDEPGLTLPHPRMAKRAFVLAPLVELAGPDLVIPGAGRAGDLLSAASADPAQIVRPIG